MWSGSISTIPEGWLLCTGQNGTPDLRSRFIVGAATTGAVLSTGLTLKQVNDISGSETHTLTEAQMPSHSHGYSDATSNDLGGSREWEYNGMSHKYNSQQTTSTGGNAPHNNMPPYYALAYIMKK